AVGLLLGRGGRREGGRRGRVLLLEGRVQLSLMGRYYLTTPIYYVNDVPHIGSAYTTIAADILARFHRLRGDEVLFATGTDEHAPKVAEAAKERGVPASEYVDQVAQRFAEAWERLNSSHDVFIRTSEKPH